jgi:folate-binding protein YgfZ
MNPVLKAAYNHIRSGGTAFYERKRGVLSVYGGEAEQFLDGLVSNEVKGLDNGAQRLAAFPNAQGRLLAVVRVMMHNGKFLIETEEVTHQVVFDTLFKFTFAGEFFVEDLSDRYRFITVYDRSFVPITPPYVEFEVPGGVDYFVDVEDASDFLAELRYFNAVNMSDELVEIVRVENGDPKYGVDMDETTIVPELGNDRMISYNKGCYIGQEIIARIHFRGHVAKKLTGIVLSDGDVGLEQGAELTSSDGKNAGRITSVAYSPTFGKPIALAYVRHEFLPEGTQLKSGEHSVVVKSLPFV